MELEAGLSGPVSPIPKSYRRGRRRFTLALLGVLLLVIVLFLLLASKPVTPFAWLTQAEMARLTQAGPLTRLKDKVMILTAPLWRRYWNRRPQILIDSRLLTLSTAAAEQTGLGAPVATNSDGMRAWILSPAELSSFLQRLKTTPDASLLSRPRAQTAAGTSARTFFGNTVLLAGNNVPVGLTLELSPEVRSGSIQVLLGVRSTESVGSTATNAAALSTNLAVACRVLLPNSGGLVVAGGNSRDLRGTNYWLILSPTAVDARGQPIKL
jgi:hypothetical protein